MWPGAHGHAGRLGGRRARYWSSGRWGPAQLERPYAGEHGRDPGGDGGMDRPVADRLRLVPGRCEHAGEAAAVLRSPVSAGGGGRHLLRAARRADRPGLGGTDPGRVHLQHQGVQPVHPAPHAGEGAAHRPACGRGPGREGPGVPQGRRPGAGRPGVGPVPGRARAAARCWPGRGWPGRCWPGRGWTGPGNSARSCCSSRPGSRSPARTRTTSWPARSAPRRAGSAWSSATTPG